MAALGQAKSFLVYYGGGEVSVGGGNRGTPPFTNFRRRGRRREARCRIFTYDMVGVVKIYEYTE